MELLQGRPKPWSATPCAPRPVEAPHPQQALEVLRTVETILTRLSVSSTQRTGTKVTRQPPFAASSSSSVSQNQPVSCTSGSSFCAHSRPIALKPHCVSRRLRAETAR